MQMCSASHSARQQLLVLLLLLQQHPERQGCKLSPATGLPIGEQAVWIGLLSLITAAVALAAATATAAQCKLSGGGIPPTHGSPVGQQHVQLPLLQQAAGMCCM